MQVQHAILHLINKSRSAESVLDLRNQEWEITDNNVEFIRVLSQNFDMYGLKAMGKFHADDISYPFQALLRKYLEDSDPDYGFLEFTKDTMNLLKARIDLVAQATGNWVLYVHLQEDDKESLFLIMIDQKSGFAIDEARKEPRPNIQVDQRSLRLSAKVDILKWQDDNNSVCISFHKQGTSSDVSKYFINFLGCTEYIQNTEATKRAIDAVDAFFDAENIAESERDTGFDRLYNYLDHTNNNHGLFNAQTFANAVWPSAPEQLLQFANSQSPPLISGFPPVPAVFKALKRVKYRKRNALSYEIMKKAFDDGDAAFIDGDIVIRAQAIRPEDAALLSKWQGSPSGE